MGSVRLGIFIFSFFICFVFLVSGDSRDGAQTELEEIKARIKKEEEKLRQKERKKEAVLLELERVERTKAMIEKELERLQNNYSEIQAEIEERERRIDELRIELKQKAFYLERRLVARYKLGEAGVMKVLFASSSFQDLVIRDEYLKRIFQHDARLISSYQKMFRKQRDEMERLKKNKKRIEELIIAQQWLRDEQDEETKKKQRLLSEVEGDQRKLLAVIGELEDAKQSLEKEFARFGREREREQESDFEFLRGRLCYPVLGVIEERFGEKIDERFNTKTFQKGIDIRAEKGTPVHSIYKGEVKFADWFRGYGNLVIIHHGANYYSLYAHLDSMRKNVGEQVEQGEVIGTVGDTGSLKGAYLYFEIRHYSSALNPELWLKRGCVAR